MGSLDIAKEGYNAFSRGDMAKFMSLCDDNIEWIYYGSVPWKGDFRGRDEVMRFFGILAGAVEIRAFGPDEFVASEDDVAVTGRTSAQIRSSGGTFENRWAHFIKVRDGKWARFIGYDTTPLSA
jgi:ketosteroid isomerase-like protein